jgi:hypothetical protein
VTALSFIVPAVMERLPAKAVREPKVKVPVKSVEFVDIEEVTPIHSPVPVVLAMTDVSATPRRTTPRILESAAAVFFCFVPVNFENV